MTRIKLTSFTPEKVPEYIEINGTILDDLENIDLNSKVQLNEIIIEPEEKIEIPIPDYLMNDPMAVGYMDGDQQSIIYELALSNKYTEDSKLDILDLGSGRCDMYNYILNDRPVELTYLALDSNPLMVKIAENKYPELAGKIFQKNWLNIKKSELTEVLLIALETPDSDFLPQVDWTFCLGSLNIDNGDGPKDKWDRLLETIRLGIFYSRKGICLVLIHSDPMESYCAYPIPECIDKIMEWFPNNKFEVTYKNLEYIYKLEVYSEGWS